jgi:hypothetical protein
MKEKVKKYLLDLLSDDIDKLIEDNIDSKIEDGIEDYMSSKDFVEKDDVMDIVTGNLSADITFS